jgi:hypothetical protein
MRTLVATQAVYLWGGVAIAASVPLRLAIRQLRVVAGICGQPAALSIK